MRQKQPNFFSRHTRGQSPALSQHISFTMKNQSKLAGMRMFLMACAELFRYDQGREWLVAHYRLTRRRYDLPA